MVEIDHWERELEEGDGGATTDSTPAQRPPIDNATTSSPITHALSRVSTVASSQQMEPILQTSSRLARPCDYFDFIVGSGTGGYEPSVAAISLRLLILLRFCVRLLCYLSNPTCFALLSFCVFAALLKFA